ncbi:MAG: acetolactate synthase large subunit [Candidatus Hydrogenedentota bacterium]|nr:MAG: acetolactate synthase large subunit [Candidatus Hydrogenedentota bacterium]
MTGAESILDAALRSGVDTCFANPGTTEMGLVAALDTTPDVRTVLALFEGVCTGMADGYGRMLDRPAMTLLHLGVGLGNGIANLHNARRAFSPIVNLIGDHPIAHIPYNAPLTSDIATMAKPVSSTVHTVTSADDAGNDMARAIAQSTTIPGGISTLILPSDIMCAETQAEFNLVEPATPSPIDENIVNAARDTLEKGSNTAIIINGRALREEGLTHAAKIAAKTDCALFSVCFPARLDRGAGLPAIQRLPYFPEQVLERLAPYKKLILVGGYTEPVSFFKYDNIPSSLVPQGCTTITLASHEQDGIVALEQLCDAVNANHTEVPMQELAIPDAPTGPLNRKTIAPAIAAALPENAIIADEGGMNSAPIYFATQSGHAHSSLFLTGGGIGYGMPSAAGAAIACPYRPVLNLQSDGAGMYTLQTLWTMARESLDVTTVVFSNRKYKILQIELERAGIDKPGPIADSLTELSNPDISWCDLAKGMGVPASRPETAEDLSAALTRSFSEEGPSLIELEID